MHQPTSFFPNARPQATSQRLISHAGLAPLAWFMDALGLRALGRDRVGQFAPPGARHEAGNMVASLVLMLAGGGVHSSDLDMIRTSPSVFGQVASNATMSRFFARIDQNSDVFEHGLATMAATIRDHVWSLAGGRGPGRTYTARDPLIIDMDHTLVGAHSDKEDAKGTYKGGYGYAPFVASIDYGDGHGGEILTTHLRPGNAGPNEAAAHIALFEDAVAALPAQFFTTEGDLIGEHVLVRTDSAGASRQFLNYLDARGVQFSVSYTVPIALDSDIHRITDKQYWQPALTADGEEREDAWVINATGAVSLKNYPAGTNIYLRAEPLHPGARASLLDHEGHRLTAFLCNSPRWDTQTLDVRHRERARCENRIKTLKNTGLGKFPFASFAANQAWASIAALTMNMITWMGLAALPAGHSGATWDIKRWRYRVFATAGKLITRSRRAHLLFPQSAPETGLILALRARIEALTPVLAPAQLQPT